MKKWYEKYKNINSSKFTVENSARKVGLPILYIVKNDKLVVIPYIRGVAEKYKIIGYTLNAPITANFPYVAILFEHCETFELVWYHYNIEYD